MKGRFLKKDPIPLLILFMFLLFGCADKQGETLRLSHITSPSSSWQKGAERFASLVEEQSRGRIRVKVFPAGQIANHNQQGELQMLGSGSIDMALVSTIILALYLDPRFDLFSLPWLFPDHQTANQILDGEIGKEILSYLEQKGIKGLAFGVNGFRQITNSVRPIKDPEDLTGIRCRVAGSRIYFRTFELFGADALTMNFGEVFTSLQQGVIDAQENPLSIVYSSRLYEVQPYLTILNYSYDPLILAMNRSRWQRFSAEDQVLLLRCAKEAMDYQRSVVIEEDRTLPGELSRKGMEVIRLDREEVQIFKERVRPIHEEYTPLIGEPLVRRCLNEVKKLKKKN
jgi:tripartite ATP-independent transporter DctP family solute receptor